jgi:hypothetical protein
MLVDKLKSIGKLLIFLGIIYFAWTTGLIESFAVIFNRGG